MKLEHIAIWVTNLEALKDFYVKYFGFSASEIYHNPKKNFTSYFLSFKDGARIELMHKPEISKINNASNSEYLGLTHLAISTGSKEKVDYLTELLRQDKFTIVGEPRTTGDGYYESVVLDPEGNRIEITD